MNTPSTENVEDTKQEIFQKEGIPSEYQRLIEIGKQLEDSRTILECQIKPESTLQLALLLKGEKQNIFVRTLTGQTIHLDINYSDNIKEIKVKIQEKVGMPLYQFALYFEGKQLEDEKTLQYYQIQNDSTLFLMRLKSTLQIFVKSLLGKTITLDVETFDTIGQIKEKVYERDIGLDQQFFILAGQKLDDEKLICSYNIQNGTTLHLILQLKLTLYVMISANKRYVIEVNPSNKIESIKKIIQEIQGTHPNQQKIIFNSKELDDENIISKCGIMNKDTLYLEL